MSTLTELTTELVEVKTAISYILKGGQSYTIDSGGGSRTVTQADLNTLYKERDRLQSQINALSQNRGARIGPGW